MAYVLSELSEAHRNYFASLKGVSGHIRDGMFVAEGPKIVEHVLRSNADVPFGFMTEEFFAHFEPMFSSRAGEITRIHVAPKSEMEAIVGFSLHQGVMLAARIPTAPDLSELLEGNGPRTIVALEGIADAENMGTIVRTCAAFGVDALIVDQTSCHPFLRRSVRVSMGTVIDLRIIISEDLPGLVTELQARDLQTIAAALTKEALPLNRAQFSSRVALLFGAEGTGLTKPLIDLTKTAVAIPMAPGIDSLNVGVACGIFLHERMRAS